MLPHLTQAHVKENLMLIIKEGSQLKDTDTDAIIHQVHTENLWKQQAEAADF